MVLEAGDAVPADGRIFENASLKIEEAALTGEAVSVNKMIDLLYLKDEEDDVPLGDRLYHRISAEHFVTDMHCHPAATEKHLHRMGCQP